MLEYWELISHLPQNTQLKCSVISNSLDFWSGYLAYLDQK